MLEYNDEQFYWRCERCDTRGSPTSRPETKRLMAAHADQNGHGVAVMRVLGESE
jgi:hypothetical protein